MDKLLKALAVAIVIFAAVLAVFVGSRVDQFAMSMLAGAFLGLFIAIPTTLLATLLITRGAPRGHDRSWYHSSPLPQSPPQYWTVPNRPQPQPPVAQAQMHMMVPQQGQLPYAMPYAGMLTNNAIPWQMPEQAQRKFYVIGESGAMEEIHAASEAEQEAPFRVVNPHMLGATSY
jgi:hypothetical protein